MSSEFPYKNLESNQDIGKKNIKRIEKEIDQFKEAVKADFESEDCERIMSALDLMLDLHCEQEDRMDGNPYVIHPLEVADDLLNKYNIKDPDLIIGALLHDSVEDQAYKLNAKLSDEEVEITNEEELRNSAFAKIGDIYGERVENMIRGLTNPNFGKIKKELEEQGIQKKKKMLYKEHVEEAIKNPDVFVIKLSDFMRNAGNIPKEGQKRNHFIEKYGPVIKNVFIPAFEEMSESHPLYEKRDEILKILNDIYETIYEADLENINSTRKENEQY